MYEAEKTGVTEIVPSSYTPELLKNFPLMLNRVNLRFQNADDWINQHASGTLRKNKRLGFAWHDQYLHERVVYEFGWCFEAVPASRVMFGRPYTEGDCHALTESGWHIERYLEFKFFPEDDFEAKYLQVEYTDGSVKEGVGIIVRKTSANWVGHGKIVFAIVAEFDKEAGKWLEAQNPF